MFRKNYLPKLNISQCSKTGKWVAYSKEDSWGVDVFVQNAEDLGEYFISSFHKPTRFESLDDLVAAIYDYAYKDHLKDIHKNLTYNKPKVKV